MLKTIQKIKVEGKDYLVVDNEVFDWEVEPEQLKIIQFKIKNDPLMKDNFIGSLFDHLTACFSEFIGKKVTLKEMNNAIEKGCIEI
jgi:hypothetical protein